MEIKGLYPGSLLGQGPSQSEGTPSSEEDGGQRGLVSFSPFILGCYPTSADGQGDLRTASFNVHSLGPQEKPSWTARSGKLHFQEPEVSAFHSEISQKS